MKSEKLLELIGGIDDRLVHSAVHPDSLQRTAWLRLAAAAASRLWHPAKPHAVAARAAGDALMPC